LSRTRSTIVAPLLSMSVQKRSLYAARQAEALRSERLSRPEVYSLTRPVLGSEPGKPVALELDPLQLRLF